MMNSI